MSGDFMWRHGETVHAAVSSLMKSLEVLHEEGWRVQNEHDFRITNGTTDLKLWCEEDSGWYFEEENA